jgi:DNA polymerase III subunit delta
MAKAQLTPLSECLKSIRDGKLLPVYLFCGEDSYLIDLAAEEITKAADKFIFSDFDKGIFWGGDDKNLADMLTMALAFPFSSDKKLLVIKDFEKLKDKKSLTGYISSPPDFTILVMIHNGSISSAASEPYKSLAQKGYLFEAKELKGRSLIKWISDYVSMKGKTISPENIQMMIEIVGENRALLEDQIEKIITYIGDKREIGYTEINVLAAETKEYTIFDLLNAIGRKDKAASFKYAYNLLEKGKEPVFLVFMIAKYFTTLSRTGEVMGQNLPPAAAAKALGILEWTYKDYTAARKLYSEKQLKKASEALLNADLSLKTGFGDEKTTISVLLGEIFSNK